MSTVFKSKKTIAITLVVSGVVLLTFIFISTKTDLLSPRPEVFLTPNEGILIAHGGGLIDGHAYTNSREALLSAADNGFRYIELDLMMTNDGLIFGAHDWKFLNEKTGKPGEDSRSFSQLRDEKFLGKYSLLFADEISDYFAADKSLTLVTDKLKDYDAITSQLNFNGFQDRMLVEVFGYKQYVRALKAGIKYPMLCVWHLKGLKKNLKRIRAGKVTMITLNAASLINEPEILPLLEELHNNGTAIFAFTSNDLDFIKQHLGVRVSGFYTDSVTPEMLRTHTVNPRRDL